MLIPKERAEANINGEGKKSPNVQPWLPPHIGRFQWSMNPCKLLGQANGPYFRRKL